MATIITSEQQFVCGVYVYAKYSNGPRYSLPFSLCFQFWFHFHTHTQTHAYLHTCVGRTDRGQKQIKRKFICSQYMYMYIHMYAKVTNTTKLRLRLRGKKSKNILTLIGKGMGIGIAFGGHCKFYISNYSNSKRAVLCGAVSVLTNQINCIYI